MPGLARISSAFRFPPALMPYFTLGYPDAETSLACIAACVEAGADLIELGVPFSDPMADGPVIQRSSERALRHGVSLKDVIAFVADFRKTDRATPVVLFGYANPIEAMGVERFADDEERCGHFESLVDLDDLAARRQTGRRFGVIGCDVASLRLPGGLRFDHLGQNGRPDAACKCGFDEFPSKNFLHFYCPAFRMLLAAQLILRFSWY